MRFWTLSLGLLAAVGLFLAGPVAQPADYHAFVDSRAWRGLANAGNVLSNFAFIAAGLWGAYVTWQRRAQTSVLEKTSTLFISAGLLLTSVGSSHYHLAPSNQALVWDRLPMTLVFAGVAGLVLARHAPAKFVAAAMAVVQAVALVGVAQWAHSEAVGASDLRVYIWSQAMPALVLLAVCAGGFARGRERRFYVGGLACYVLAKAAEGFDAQIFAITAHGLSGHTLKHLVAALACASILSARPSREGEARTQ